MTADPRKIRNTLTWYQATVMPTNPLGYWTGWSGFQSVELPFSPGGVASCISPWQHEFMAYTLFELCERGYAAKGLRDPSIHGSPPWMVTGPTPPKLAAKGSARSLLGLMVDPVERGGVAAEARPDDVKFAGGIPVPWRSSPPALRWTGRHSERVDGLADCLSRCRSARQGARVGIHVESSLPEQPDGGDSKVYQATNGAVATARARREGIHVKKATQGLRGPVSLEER